MTEHVEPDEEPDTTGPGPDAIRANLDRIRAVQDSRAEELRTARRARREPGGDPASDHPVDQARRAKITRSNP